MASSDPTPATGSVTGDNLSAEAEPKTPRSRPPWALLALGVLAAAGLVYVLVSFGGYGQPTARGQQLPNQGQDHLRRGQPHPPYNSVPPTSGWHSGSWADWGVHTEPIPDEQQVHNLEHGGVVVQYNCPAGCPDVAAQLERIVRQYPGKVILAPYPNMPSRIALTAWTWIDTFDQVDAGRITAFITAHVNCGPEFVPDDSTMRGARTAPRTDCPPAAPRAN